MSSRSRSKETHAGVPRGSPNSSGGQKVPESAGFDIRTPVFSSSHNARPRSSSVGPNTASILAGLASPQTDMFASAFRLRRSPRAVHKPSPGPVPSLPSGSGFSPRVFWRSPVAYAKKGFTDSELLSLTPSVAQAPLEIPPPYMSTMDSDVLHQSDDGGQEQHTSRKRSRSMSSKSDFASSYQYEESFDGLSEEVKLAASGTGVDYRPNPATAYPRKMDKATKDTGSSCHQCKSRRTYDQLVFCNDNDVTAEKLKRPCRKKYCFACLGKFYGERIPRANEHWPCPSCRGECTCAACKRQKDKVAHKKFSSGRSMSPATSVAYGLVFMKDKLNGGKPLRPRDMPPRLLQAAEAGAERILMKSGGRGPVPHSFTDTFPQPVPLAFSGPSFSGTQSSVGQHHSYF